MQRSNFKWLVMSLMVLGVLSEINTSYRNAIGLTEIAMPTARVMRIPSQFRNTITENPMVHEYDQMTMMSGAVMIWSD